MTTQQAKKDKFVDQNPEEYDSKKFYSRRIPVNKQNGLRQFSNTKVQSCSRIVLMQGHKQAIPLFTRSKEYRDPSPVHWEKTTTDQSYTFRRAYKYSSPDKPLIPYDPNHERNRLPVIFKKPRIKSSLFTEPAQEDPRKHHATEGPVRKMGARSSILYQSVEHSYIGNFKGLEDETSNHEINMIRRRKHRNLSRLLN